MLSMAMGLLGALLPDISCSVRTCGERRGWGADVEPPVVPMLAGGEGGTSPETAWTAYEGKGREEAEKWGGRRADSLPDNRGKVAETQSEGI